MDEAVAVYNHKTSLEAGCYCRERSAFRRNVMEDAQAMDEAM